MSLTKHINDFTDEELELEMERRKLINGDKPIQPLPNIDIERIKSFALGVRDHIASDARDCFDNVDSEGAYETVIESVFGEEFWSWAAELNKKHTKHSNLFKY
jgi:hypothetical protein